MKIVISIFSLPYEIDELENTLSQLRKASYYLSGNNEWELDVSLGLSDTLVNWKNSRIPKEYFILHQYKQYQMMLKLVKTNKDNK